MLVAREALALARGLRWRQLVLANQPLGDALAAAVVIEHALADEAPQAIEFTDGEAREVLRLVGRRQRALYRALRRHLGEPERSEAGTPRLLG